MAEKIHSFYTIVQMAITLISLLYGIIYWEKIQQHGYLKLFPLYTGVSLFISIPWFFQNIFYFPGILIQNIFIVFEFFIYYHFFLQVLKGKKFRFILSILSIIYCLSILVINAWQYNIQNKYLDILTFLNHSGFSELIVIKSILTGIPILLYYKTLFNLPYIKNLRTDPVFLVMTGILFRVTVSIPVFAFQKMILPNNIQLYLYLYIINAFANIIMHLFFIKAYKSIQ